MPGILRVLGKQRKREVEGERVREKKICVASVPAWTKLRDETDISITAFSHTNIDTEFLKV